MSAIHRQSNTPPFLGQSSPCPKDVGTGQTVFAPRKPPLQLGNRKADVELLIYKRP
jgi:hypothetical protein